MNFPQLVDRRSVRVFAGFKISTGAALSASDVTRRTDSPRS